MEIENEVDKRKPEDSPVEALGEAEVDTMKKYVRLSLISNQIVDRSLRSGNSGSGEENKGFGGGGNAGCW